MSEFNLDPWEIGPRCREALDGTAHREVGRDAYRVVRMIQKKWIVFVRDLRDPNAGNWVVGCWESDSPCICTDNPAPWRITGINPYIGRFFVWREEMAFLDSGGNGVWLDSSLEAETPFFNAASVEVIKRSSRETFACLTRELDSNSDFAVARRWRTLDSEAKRASLYDGAERLEELRSVMFSILVLNAVADSDHRNYTWHISTSGEQLRERGMRHFGRPPLLGEWEEIVCKTLAAYSAGPMRKHPCIAQFAADPESCIEVEIQSIPTQHEHLEAHMFLQEWLQDKLRHDDMRHLITGME